MKKFKYHITYVDSKSKKCTDNFKTKDKMLKYLNDNTDKLNQLKSVTLNFNQVSLPLKQTVWHVRTLTERQKQKLEDKEKLEKFVSKLEK